MEIIPGSEYVDSKIIPRIGDHKSDWISYLEVRIIPGSADTWQQPVLMQFSPAFEHAGKLGTIWIQGIQAAKRGVSHSGYRQPKVSEGWQMLDTGSRECEKGGKFWTQATKGVRL